LKGRPRAGGGAVRPRACGPRLAQADLLGPGPARRRWGGGGYGMVELSLLLEAQGQGR